MADESTIDDADYVVVGAGSSGCVVAARLSEDPAARVVLLEHGNPNADDLDPYVPVHVFDLAATSRARPIASTGQGRAGSQTVELVTGTGPGGSSMINAMGWFQGHPDDYARWVAEGATGWTWQTMLEVYRSIESHELGASEFHGAGGPLSITSPRYLHPLALSFIDAATELGWPQTRDLNGAQRTGATLAHSTVRDGARYNVADAYLEPARQRDNLEVRVGASVRRVVFDRSRAVGVEVDLGSGPTVEVRARRGVILTAGALRTPQLLMLSGIGPGDDLRRHGIDVVVDAPGVGSHLQDHPTVPVPFRIRRPEASRDWTFGDPAHVYEVIRRGPWSTFGQSIAAVAAGERASDPAAPAELHFGFTPVGAEVGLPPVDGPSGICLVALIDPLSRGTVRLRSADIGDDPIVDPRYLADTTDRERMRTGVRMAYRLLAATPMRDHVDPLTPLPSTDDTLDQLIDGALGSYYHYLGTARMGERIDGAVVDPALAVHGTSGLWVGDASVMPRTPRGLIQAPTIALAERAARLIARAATAP